MKKTIILISLILLVVGSVKSQNWEKDMTHAKSLTLEQNRKIVLVFQGSDWCVPCIKLDREIWNTEEFKKYAKDNFVMLQADFPRKKKNKLPQELEEKNNLLAERYNKHGYFPLVLVLDKDGKVLGTTGYKKTTPLEYEKLLSSF